MQHPARPLSRLAVIPWQIPCPPEHRLAVRNAPLSKRALFGICGRGSPGSAIACLLPPGRPGRAGRHPRLPVSLLMQRRWPGTRRSPPRGSCAARHRGICAPWPHVAAGREDLLCVVRPMVPWGADGTVTSSRRGARGGASERRHRAVTGDVERLRLLVEPHPATSGYWLDLYGMQEVWGSNPHSSTSFPRSDSDLWSPPEAFEIV